MNGREIVSKGNSTAIMAAVLDNTSGPEEPNIVEYDDSQGRGPVTSLLSFTENDGKQKDLETAKTFEENTIEFEVNIRKPLMYRVSQTPPLHLLILFALQQSLLSISAPLGVTMILSEIVCAQKDDAIKTEILSASFFMVGLSTIAMSTIGVRLPIFQGPAGTYLVPLLAMSALPEWKCPEFFKAVNPRDNSTVLMTAMDNGTLLTAREVILQKISALSGSLVLAGALHFVIGLTGLVGILLRFVGPLTIVPAIVMVGLHLHKIQVVFCQTSWLVAALTSAMTFILSLFLADRMAPIPLWSRGRGFYILWYPLHQAFSVLLSTIFGWILSVILTNAGALTDDPNSVQYLARTDARSEIIATTDWFIFPYPGKFGPLSFSAAGFISFFVATIMSVLDSIGDYNACARAIRAPPPPRYAFNRGIGVEGLMSFLGGFMGCCHATLSYGGNIGAIDVTGVASRRVFQCCGLIYILFAIFGKVGALFITIPYSVLGGSSFILNGIFIGLVLSNLQFVNINSTRNLSIIGCSMLLGLMMPHWIQQNPDAIDTGNEDADNVIQILLTNSSFVAGCFACIMDNMLPGTLKERGLLNQLKELDDEDAKKLAKSYEDGEEVYWLPFIPEAFRKSKLAKYIPIISYNGK